jgi:hypothetical protein
VTNVANNGTGSGALEGDPWYNLAAGTDCNQVSVWYDFVDYFLYQPLPRIANHPSVWVPANAYTGYGWNWAGTAQKLPTLTWN